MLVFGREARRLVAWVREARRLAREHRAGACELEWHTDDQLIAELYRRSDAVAVVVVRGESFLARTYFVDSELARHAADYLHDAVYEHED